METHIVLSRHQDTAFALDKDVSQIFAYQYRNDQLKLILEKYSIAVPLQKAVESYLDR